VEEDDLQRRRQQWTPPELDIPKGYLSMYARMASSADQGAILK